MIFIFNTLKYIYISLIFLSIFIPIFFIPAINSDSINSISPPLSNEIFDINSTEYSWPIPGYTNISSPFGKRFKPTTGASSFHYGIDIPAPEGSKFIAVKDGRITFRDFLGAGGYTITLSFDNYKITYCHSNPNFIVNVGDFVKKGQVIGEVGPKYVDGVVNNPYHDSIGYTNGATTGPHLHFGVRKDNKYINPLNLYN